MLPRATRILVCTQPQDMRRSFDRLSSVVRDVLGHDPMDGTLYVFIGKTPTRVKVLWWDRNGYCLLVKRLHRALIRRPRAVSDQASTVSIDGQGLAELLEGVDRKTTRSTRQLH